MNLRSIITITTILWLIYAAAALRRPCHVQAKNRTERILSPRPHETLKLDDIPTSFDWRDVNGKNFLTVTRNQHLPRYCGSCWAFAATSVISDRIRILSPEDWLEVNLAPQVLLNCGYAGTCSGGDSLAAFQYIAQEGIPDETCAPYRAIEQNCTALNLCKTCARDFIRPNNKCQPVKPNIMWKVSEYGAVHGEAQMMAEIFARGPIACSVAVTPAFIQYKRGIFQDTTGATYPDHEVSIVGWGTDQQTGQNYWIGRNSWGTPWGELGFFRLVRGSNNLGIESNGCTWAVPIMPQ